MDSDSTRTIILSLVFSGALASFLSTVVSYVLTKRNLKIAEKRKILSDLIGNRLALTPQGTDLDRQNFFSVLNSVVFVFEKNEDVIEALNNFHADKVNTVPNFETLVTCIAKDLKLKKISKYKKLIREPFYYTGKLRN